MNKPIALDDFTTTKNMYHCSFCMQAMHETKAETKADVRKYIVWSKIRGRAEKKIRHYNHYLPGEFDLRGEVITGKTHFSAVPM